MDLLFIAHNIYSWGRNILSAIAIMEVLLLIIRKVFKLEEHITVDRIEWLNKIMLVASMVIGLVLLVEYFTIRYSPSHYEQFAFYSRALGKYWWAYLVLLGGNLLFPQLYWVKTLRRNLYITIVVAVLVNLDIGAWLERFIIIATSLTDDYLSHSLGH